MFESPERECSSTESTLLVATYKDFPLHISGKRESLWSIAHIPLQRFYYSSRTAKNGLIVIFAYLILSPYCLPHTLLSLQIFQYQVKTFYSLSLMPDDRHCRGKSCTSYTTTIDSPTVYISVSQRQTRSAITTADNIPGNIGSKVLIRKCRCVAGRRCWLMCRWCWSWW